VHLRSRCRSRRPVHGRLIRRVDDRRGGTSSSTPPSSAWSVRGSWSGLWAAPRGRR